MNQKAFSLAGVTETEYRTWCKENKKPASKPETRADFFARIQDGRLVKDSSGRLIKKYRKN